MGKREENSLMQGRVLLSLYQHQDKSIPVAQNNHSALHSEAKS